MFLLEILLGFGAFFVLGRLISRAMHAKMCLLLSISFPDIDDVDLYRESVKTIKYKKIIYLTAFLSLAGSFFWIISNSVNAKIAGSFAVAIIFIITTWVISYKAINITIDSMGSGFIESSKK